MTNRRTKRRYAHELYPHAEEFETRNLADEVPYLYARAIGFSVRGTGWFALPPKESVARTEEKINAEHIALLADAMHQGLTGQEAWAWVDQRLWTYGDAVYDRAVHYGVPVEQIKPYPCGPTPAHHDHVSAPDARGWQIVTDAPGPEEECQDCTEEVEPRP